jgi:PAS domain S-box
MAAASCFDEIVYEDGKPVDYRIIDVNPSYERIIGIPKSVAVGALASKLYGTGEAPFLDVYSKVGETGHSASFEAYFSPSEKYLHIMVSCPGRGQFFTVFSDITERKRNEKLLQESEKRYRILFESSRDAIMLMSQERKFLHGNPAAIKMFGCNDNEELTSLNVMDLSPEHQPDGTLSLIKAEQMVKIALKKGSHFFEWKHKQKDGKEFFTTVLLAKMELDNEIILQGTVRDITENKLTEESLKKFKTIAEEQAIGNAIADIEGNLIYFNKAFAKMHGYNDKELIGKNLAIFLDEEQQGEINRVPSVKKWFETISEFVSKEVWRVRKDGSVFPALVNVAVIKDAKGESLFFV